MSRFKVCTVWFTISVKVLLINVRGTSKFVGLTTLVRRQSAHMLDVRREQKADFASGMHPFDGSWYGMVVPHDPWLSRDIFESE